MVLKSPPRLWSPPRSAQPSSSRSSLSSLVLASGKTQDDLTRALTPRLTKFIPHEPTVTQTAFLLVPGREAFFGGAAGGGKSDALLMAALQYADTPGYAALLLRKSFADLQLPGAIMDRAYGWLSGRPDCRWNERDHRWEFESGAVLQFGYLDRARDRYRYQSAEFQFVGFDELTQFEIDEYLYLATRLRRLVGSTTPVRLRSASNPGGVGHEWVKARFIPRIEEDPLTGGRVVEYPRDADGRRRPFIPSRLSDNPHLDRADYVKSLLMVDPTLRAQMLDGDWTAAKPGTKFKRGWFGQIIDVAPKLVKRAVYVDLASTEETGDNDPDWTSAHWGGMTATGQMVIEGELHIRNTPSKVEAALQALAERLNPDMPGRYPIWIEQEPGSAGKTVISNYQRRILPGYVVRGLRPTGDKWTRADLLASMAERGDVLLVRGLWVPGYIEEMVSFSSDDTHSHDDRVDSTSGLSVVLFKAAGAASRSYIGGHKEEVIRKGDLVLRGRQYIDKTPRRA